MLRNVPVMMKLIKENVTRRVMRKKVMMKN